MMLVSCCKHCNHPQGANGRVIIHTKESATTFPCHDCLEEQGLCSACAYGICSAHRFPLPGSRPTEVPS